jgi:hypothetical protein
VNGVVPAALGVTVTMTAEVPTVDDLMVTETVPVESDVPDVALSLAPVVPVREKATA